MKYEEEILLTNLPQISLLNICHVLGKPLQQEARSWSREKWSIPQTKQDVEQRHESL